MSATREHHHTPILVAISLPPNWVPFSSCLCCGVPLFLKKSWYAHPAPSFWGHGGPSAAMRGCRSARQALPTSLVHPPNLLVKTKLKKIIQGERANCYNEVDKLESNSLSAWESGENFLKIPLEYECSSTTFSSMVVSGETVEEITLFFLSISSLFEFRAYSNAQKKRVLFIQQAELMHYTDSP